MISTIDRKTPPAQKPVTHIDLLQVNEYKLDNDIPVFYINGGTQEVVKIEFLFPSGSWMEPKPVVAFAVSSMLNEGTQHLSGADIADKIDYYGAFLHTHSSANWASVTLYSLNKHIANTLPVIKEILTESVFPEKEFETFRRNQKQNLIVNNERVDYIAKRKFSEILFGSRHPYGHYVSLADYDSLTTDDLKSFCKQYYNAGHCKILVSGKVDEKVLLEINKSFGEHDWDNQQNKNHNIHKLAGFEYTSVKKHFIEKKDAVQSAIRIGKPIFNKTHPDYFGMLFLNTVLGGYFSSRLMKNIREDKGYTYSIGSAVVSLYDAGYFFITTEAGVNVCSRTVDEIYAELKLLKTEQVSETELELVRNYLMGTFLRSIDGPFALADKYKGIMLYGLGYDYYQNFLDTVQNIRPDTLTELACKYFDEDSLCELVVGKK